MGMTLTQKILAAHAGLAEVKAGQLINAKLDIVLGNDITTPVAVNEFEKAGFHSVFANEHIAIVLDHFVPNKDIKSAQQSKQCREFANQYDILNFYDVGQMGVEHALDSDTNSRACSYVGLKWASGEESWGCGTHTDIIVAGIKALVSAINNK